MNEEAVALRIKVVSFLSGAFVIRLIKVAIIYCGNEK